jgi:hypothetical protein
MLPSERGSTEHSPRQHSVAHLSIDAHRGEAEPDTELMLDQGKIRLGHILAVRSRIPESSGGQSAKASDGHGIVHVPFMGGIPAFAALTNACTERTAFGRYPH